MMIPNELFHSLPKAKGLAGKVSNLKAKQKNQQLNIIKNMLVRALFILTLLTYVQAEIKPLSACTKCRITGYDDYDHGACGFGVPTIYGAAPNADFYYNGNKCGICYELVGQKSVIKFIVSDVCPVFENNEKCITGLGWHFDMNRDAFKAVAEEIYGNQNATFRMV